MKRIPILLGALVIPLPLLGLYAYGVWRQAVPFYPVALAYALMSLITFAFYYHDKRAAIENERRTPEAVLHLLELCGGWPGALVGQIAFRHKVKKISYQFAFWLIVICHCAIWYTVRTESVRLQTMGFLPKSVSSRISSFFQHCQALSAIISPASLTSNDPPQPKTTPAPELKQKPIPTCPPLTNPQPIEPVWTRDPATEPLIIDPKVRRSLVVAHKQSRRLTGEIKAVSPSQGLLVALPPEIGGDGVIAPSTLIADFHRRFRIGEQVEVAVKGVSMKGSRKQLELLLVER